MIISLLDDHYPLHILIFSVFDAVYVLEVYFEILSKEKKPLILSLDCRLSPFRGHLVTALDPRLPWMVYLPTLRLPSGSGAPLTS